MAQNKQPLCLHCLLSNVMERYIEKYGIEDSEPLFFALSEVVGDLLANNADVYAEREAIMAEFVADAFQRAQGFIKGGEDGGEGEGHEQVH